MGIADLSFSDAQEAFLVTEIDFYIPAPKITLEQ
jgi:hypothetical protein